MRIELVWLIVGALFAFTGRQGGSLFGLDRKDSSTALLIAGGVAVFLMLAHLRRRTPISEGMRVLLVALGACLVAAISSYSGGDDLGTFVSLLYAGLLFALLWFNHNLGSRVLTLLELMMLLLALTVGVTLAGYLPILVAQLIGRDKYWISGALIFVSIGAGTFCGLSAGLSVLIAALWNGQFTRRDQIGIQRLICAMIVPALLIAHSYAGLRFGASASDGWAVRQSISGELFGAVMGVAVMLFLGVPFGWVLRVSRTPFNRAGGLTLAGLAGGSAYGFIASTAKFGPGLHEWDPVLIGALVGCSLALGACGSFALFEALLPTGDRKL